VRVGVEGSRDVTRRLFVGLYVMAAQCTSGREGVHVALVLFQLLTHKSPALNEGDEACLLCSNYAQSLSGTFTTFVVVYKEAEMKPTHDQGTIEIKDERADHADSAS
jgi:hypothetical protein